jgi:hypothetical protein
MKRLLVVLAVGLITILAVVGATGIDLPARAMPSTATTPHDTSGSDPFTKTETITRSNINGTGTDTRTVTLNVSQTGNLQGRQEIQVSWTGAHPTGGIVADQNSASAQNEEYPFVLLECRGTDSTSVPAAQQHSPETCWTQTWSERYQDSLGTAYPPYRLDQDATPSPQPAIVGAPSTLPASCQYDESAPVQHWVPFIAADGTTFLEGNAGCGGEAPESDDVGGAAMPSNETFGVTGTDGSGTANFDVWTSTQNQSLGCSETVACSLVAVPIMGITCNPNTPAPAADLAACESAGTFTPGQLMPAAGGPTGDPVTGSLWWSPSNWQNRISVPLSFAPSSAVCGVTGSASKNVVDVYGSELMIQATGQWEPNFCLDNSSPFSFVHVQTGEPQARNLLATGGAEAVFTSDAQPGGYGKPVVNAPVAFTGFAISYAIDGADGQPYTTLKLTPLLLAKLLTESYAGDLFMQQDDPDLAHNPIDITTDPQFIALNPGITQYTLGPSEAASELIAMSGGSDVMEALTTYINDDPTARAWLNGTPDPNGMVVNPAYKGIQLPVSTWPLLSTYEPTDYYQSDLNDCLYNSPVPFQPLVAAPLATLEDISESLQYNLPNSTTTCSEPDPGVSTGEKLTSSGRQSVGYRFMIGITPLADNQRYQLQSAELETTSGTFVAPDDDSLKAAASLLQPDTTSGTWPIPYDQFQQSAGASAYPGSMVVYAAVPTSGLPAADAQAYSSLLNFAATTGQTQGYGVGQLPPGYLPLTAADGLGALASYTQAAATDVAAQNGQVPSLTATASATPTTTATGSNSSGTSTGAGSYGYAAGPLHVRGGGPADRRRPRPQGSGRHRLSDPDRCGRHRMAGPSPADQAGVHRRRTERQGGGGQARPSQVHQRRRGAGPWRPQRPAVGGARAGSPGGRGGGLLVPLGSFGAPPDLADRRAGDPRRPVASE